MIVLILFLKPYFEDKPWGGNTLSTRYDCNPSTGEAWIVSGFKGKSSIIKNGIYKGETLRSLWIKHKELFGDFPDKEFPVLIKLIDAADKLSIQVHPDDEYALMRNNQLGKFECWYILPETKNSKIIAGVNAKSRKELKMLIDNNLLDTSLIKRDIKPDDLVIIEPGTVHAILKDTFLLEVQETSDITYRLYDYNREPLRELHIEDALNVVKFKKNNPVHDFKEPNSYQNDFFDFHKVIVDGTVSYESNNFEICYVIDGSCILAGKEVHSGDTFILTKEMNTIIASGKAKILVIVPKPKNKERLKMRKVALITGIVGQDGSYLTDFLLEKGYEVHGIIQSYSQINNPSLRHLVSNKEVMNVNLFLHIGDLTDSSNINRIIENVKPDEIYHLASQSHVDISFEIPEYTTEVNSLGTLRILDAIKESGIRSKVFNSSTCLLYGGDSNAKSEKSPFDPKNPYAVSKMYAHYMVKNYRDNYGIYAVNGILFSHDSPRREATFVSQKIIQTVKKIMAGKEECLYLGNINAKREWGHAKEYAIAMWLMLQQDTPDDYVVSVECVHPVREFVEKTFKYYGIDLVWEGTGFDEVGKNKKNGDILVRIDKSLFRVKDHDVLLGDCTKFKTATNWKYQITMEELIKDMIENSIE